MTNWPDAEGEEVTPAVCEREPQVEVSADAGRVDGTQSATLPRLSPEGALAGVLRYPWRYIGIPRGRLHEWIVAVLGSGLKEFRVVAHRIAKHLDAVIAGHQHDVPLGLVEATDDKIATLCRQARGYRDSEYFKLKIFQRCSRPSKPWTAIVLQIRNYERSRFSQADCPRTALRRVR